MPFYRSQSLNPTTFNTDPNKVPTCPAKLILLNMQLLVGLILSQLIPEWVGSDVFQTWTFAVKVTTMVCVSFIMIHVGFHFDIDKSQMRTYGKEYAVAMTAAGFPWLLCALWFIFALGEEHNLPWQEALIAARFAAPTSAGILFTMLEASGMKTTWLFQKARILAIFDDIDTLLLMVPLKMFFVGLKWELAIELVFVCILLILMWAFLHRLNVPVTWPWILSYAVGIAGLCEGVHYLTSSGNTDPYDIAETVHLEVLLPAFAIGCILKGQDVANEPSSPPKTLSPAISIKPETVKASISAIFMVLVGLSMPPLFTNKHDEISSHRRLASSRMSAGPLALHVVICSIMMNLGKLVPAMCYRSEASWRERLALAVAMMPRGEVGAAIIVNALAMGISGAAMTVALFCLASNMMMMSGFIVVVRKLTAGQVSCTSATAEASLEAAPKSKLSKEAGAARSTEQAAGPPKRAFTASYTKRAVGSILALCAGMVNAVAFLALRSFVSHTTGSLSKVGLGFKEGEVSDALECLFLVLAFTGGSTICGFLIRQGSSGFPLYDLGLVTETGLLIMATLTAEGEAAKYLAATACGLQNAMTTQWGSAVLRTTHVTGLFTDTGLLMGKMLSMLTRKRCGRGFDATDKSQWADDGSKLSLLLALAISFFVGVYTGAWFHHHMEHLAFLVPAAICGMGGLVYFAWRVVVLRQRLFSSVEPEFKDITLGEPVQESHAEKKFKDDAEVPGTPHSPYAKDAIFSSMILV